MKRLRGRISIGILISALSLSVHAQKPIDGHAVFDQWCAICHAAGPYMAGTIVLQRNYQGQKPALLQLRTDLTPDEIKVFVRRGVIVMPRFRKTEISDAQLDALANYLAHAASDHTAP